MHISACYYIPKQLYLISMTETIRYKLVKNTFKQENRTFLLNKNMNHLWRLLGDRSISLMGKGWESWASSASRREHREQISSMHTSTCKVVSREWASLLLVASSNRANGNSHKLKNRKFHLNVRKNFFPLKEKEERKRLLRVVVKLLSLEIFETRRNMIQCNPF